MKNHSGKKFRGRTELRSRLFIEDEPKRSKGKTKRQCGACKHQFEVPTKVPVRCPVCKGQNTRVIA